MDKPLLTHNLIQAIERTLGKGDRVEIIPVKDGVKVLRIRREEISCRGATVAQRSCKPQVAGSNPAGSSI